MAKDIETTVAELKAQHMPIRVAEYTGSATPTARASEGQGPEVAAAQGGGQRPAGASTWRGGNKPMNQPLPIDRRYFREMAPIGGRALITIQPGTRAVRAAMDKLGSAIADGVDGHHVRVMQSFGEGPVLIASSDPADAARIFTPKHDPNGVYAKLAAMKSTPPPVLGGGKAVA